MKRGVVENGRSVDTAWLLMQVTSFFTHALTVTQWMQFMGGFLCGVALTATMPSLLTEKVYPGKVVVINSLFKCDLICQFYFTLCSSALPWLSFLTLSRCHCPSVHFCVHCRHRHHWSMTTWSVTVFIACVQSAQQLSQLQAWIVMCQFASVFVTHGFTAKWWPCSSLLCSFHAVNPHKKFLMFSAF